MQFRLSHLSLYHFSQKLVYFCTYNNNNNNNNNNYYYYYYRLVCRSNREMEFCKLVLPRNKTALMCDTPVMRVLQNVSLHCVG